MTALQDNTLLTTVEELFTHTENVVISAIQVAKRVHDASPTGAKLLKSLAGESEQDSLQPRIFAFTVKRSNTQTFVATLHVIKVHQVGGGASRLEVGKSWRLDLLRRVKVVPRQYQHGERVYVVLSIAPHQQYQEYTASYAFSNRDELLLFLSITLQLDRHMEEDAPELAGVEEEEVVRWWSTSSSTMMPRFSAFAARLIAPGQEVRSSAEAASVLVSVKEEKDLEELLDMFAMGVGDTDTFQECLLDEFHALEAANVHAVLESAPVVEAVMNKLRRAQGLLDDLDESLKVFDFKLRHMRDDIAAIEASNNALELQARNNSKLLSSLQGLLADVRLDPQAQRVLENPFFEPDRISGTLEAGWALHRKLQRMNPECDNHLPNGLLSMRVSREANGLLLGLATRFVARACTYLNTVFNDLADQTLQQLGKVSGQQRLRAPKRDRLRALVGGYVELVRLLRELDPPSLARLQASYCSTLNTIIRKEMRNCTNELRKAATSEAATSAFDFTMQRTERALKISRTQSQSRMSRKGGASIGGSSDTTPESSNPSISEPAALFDWANSSRGLRSGGEGGSMALHDGYRTLLATFIPTLLDEADFAAEFLLFYAPPGGEDEEYGGRAKAQPRVLQQNGVAAAEMLMAGIEDDFRILVDLTTRNQQVLCIPMLAVTDRWLARVEGEPIAARIHRALSACRTTLTANFEAFVLQLQTNVEKFDAKATISSKLQTGVKHLHVLPFISQFGLLANHCELHLKSITAEDDLDRPPSPSASHHLGDDDTPAASGTHVPARKLVDGTYDRLTTAIFAALEKVAAADPKRGDRLRLENYWYFAESVRPLVPLAQALKHYHSHANKCQAEAMQRYVGQQLEYGKLLKVVELEEKVAGFLKVVTPAEVPFQVGCTLTEVKQLLAGALQKPEQRLAAMHARIKKHLGSSGLAAKVWGELQKTLLSRYTRLEGLMSRCYPHLPLRPSPEELGELFKVVR